MKYSVLFCIIFLVVFVACNQSANNSQRLQSRIDSLEQTLKSIYKPGFGEFMSGIQVHHNKLWFAGQNQNWKLADFEINEIQEALTGIKAYCTDRPETKEIGMIDAPIDSLTKAIQLKSKGKFISGYLLLTNSCNSCHRITNHEFNVIKIPDSPPFTNQDFKLQIPKDHS